MTGPTRTLAKNLLLALPACAAIGLFGSACGSEKSNGDQAKGAGGSTDPRAAGLDRAGQPDETPETRFEVLGSSPSNTRPSAGTADENQGGGGGGGGAESARLIDEAEAARRRENQARCDRLVEHYVSLTGDRMGKRAGREALDKLEAQTDSLRQACASGAWLTPEYERCALAADTLDEAIACSVTIGPRSAKAFEQAKELSTRKDLLKKAEKKIEAGDVPKPEVDVRPNRNP
jgi:hypothetical protein